RALLRLERDLALRADLELRGRRELAGRLELRLHRLDVLLLLLVPLQDRQRHRSAALDLDQAHPAVRRDAQPGVPAVVGDLDTRSPRGADDGVAFLERDVLAIKLERGHRSSDTARGGSAIALAADHVDRPE